MTKEASDAFGKQVASAFETLTRVNRDLAVISSRSAVHHSLTQGVAAATRKPALSNRRLMQKARSGDAADMRKDEIAALKQDISSLVPRIDAGGRKARCGVGGLFGRPRPRTLVLLRRAALIRLISLSAKQ